MSGGVDSTVTAALLQRAGYDVVGITLQLYDHGAALKKGACCAGQDIHDARTAAERLGMPHYVLDYESRFREAVIEDFADAYLRGETPSPASAAIRRSSSATCSTSRATWAPRPWPPATMSAGGRADGPELHRAADATRDQSYFLFATTREQLDFLRFPLGGMPKTRCAAAAELGPAVATKPDSQDICFVPEGRYTTIIDKLRPHGALPGRHRAHGRPRARPPRGRHPLHRRPAARPERRRRRAPVRGPAGADKREVIVGPREALLTAP